MVSRVSTSLRASSMPAALATALSVPRLALASTSAKVPQQSQRPQLI